MFRQVFSVAPR